MCGIKTTMFLQVFNTNKLRLEGKLSESIRQSRACVRVSVCV